ncbi:hypothetical protein DFH09DRAFT_1373692 [Mycena vulgaris]|nr:hypothetical protein DFH09DRAFT_1373692 [Mycena vulgaris]
MITRKLENTWQVDSFGEVSAVSRPPDEAIVLCLDLSESMNERSGVTKPVDGNKEESFNVGIEAERLVQRLTEDMNDDEIMEKARAHLKSQHVSCHHPWWVLVIFAGAGIAARDLLRELAAIASREALLLSFKEEENDQDTEEDDDFYGDGGTSNRSRTSDALLRLACFATAVTNNDEMHEKLAQFVMDMLQDAQSDVIGTEPYSVPRTLVDFKTGDLLVDPIRPKNAPLRTFVNSTSKAWFESQPRWPLGHCVLEYDSVTKLKKAVATWIAGTDILPKIKKSSKGETISVTFRHLEKDHTWILLPQTPIQTLYSLVNRATQAAYGSFLLLTSHSNAILSSTSHLLISQTDLARGGAIEIQRSTRHTRQPYEIHLEGLVVSTKVLIPRNSSVLARQSYLHTPGLGLSDFIMWHGLTETGDGMRRGQVAELNTLLRYYSQGGDVLSFSCCAWRWFSTDARRSRNESKTLSRLDLLKELLNVFVNRAGSFDTTVSLVLGLVTFSNEASVEQELTPVFENFRERLETVDAKGDTAVYDALDSARQLLTNFRPDLPNLRRRIIIVSDGEDTNSSTSARVVCAALQKSRVIVDSVQVGTTSDPVLHAISVATGGYRFSPRTSLADALSIFDLETMLYSGDRPFRSAKPLVNTERQFQAYQNFSGSNAIDIVTVDKFPARAEHKKLKQRVKSAATSIARPGGGDERMKRIMREIKAVVADPHPNIDVYVNDRDMSFLKIILEAPNDVENYPYKGGTFLLTCDLPTGYPRDPPEVRFVTFILHPNVSKQGKVCIAELGRLWSSDITLKEIFSMIYGILLTPDLENPLEIQASLKYCE